MASDQIKIAIVSGASKKGDSVRGIGAHNSNLFDAFKRNSNKKIEIPEVSKDDDLSKYDVVHFTVFRPFFISLPFTKPKNTKFVLTIHDLIPLIYPSHYPAGIKGSIRFLINKYLIKKYVDRIITITETSKKDICRFINVSPDIVDVVYIAPKKVIKKLEGGKWEKEIKSKYNLPDKFVLFDHGVNYNKNVPALIKACSVAKIPLAIVGKETESIGNLDLNHPELSHLKDVDFSDVLKLGFVSDEDLNRLFNIASIYVQPSFYEGFGMPPLEAMAVGCPVICSKTQALVEVCDDACLYFDPNNVNDLVDQIKTFSNDKKSREEYIMRGFEQVKKYNWDKASKETLDVYAKA
jgi:glycosyltransferase involved in cell wall biosynthesis